jgi:predicted Zn-dependent protease
MFAAGPIAAYASQVIQQRGCEFKPDATFLAAFPTPGFQAILKNIKPRAGEKSSPNRDAAYDLLRQALDATHHRQFSISDQDYHRALQLVPDSATLHLAYAANFLLMPDGTQAEPEARRSLQLWPDNAEGHGILSMALMLEGKLPESVAEARETLRLFPGHTSAKFQLAASLTKNHQYEEAVPAIRDAIAALPNFSPLHKFLGICLFQTKHTAEAIRELSWYVNADPADAEGHYYLGSALRAAGREEEAKAQFRLAPRKPR